MPPPPICSDPGRSESGRSEPEHSDPGHSAPPAGLPAERWAAGLDRLARVPGAQSVTLFGSAARGTSRSDSDIDLALLAARPLGPVDRFDLQEEVASLLGRDVDLVDLRAASTVMAAEVLRSGRVVLDVDARARAFWEVRALSAYALLNEERAVVLRAIRERGRVYG